MGEKELNEELRKLKFKRSKLTCRQQKKTNWEKISVVSQQLINLKFHIDFKNNSRKEVL